MRGKGLEKKEILIIQGRDRRWGFPGQPEGRGRGAQVRYSRGGVLRVFTISMNQRDREGGRGNGAILLLESLKSKSLKSAISYGHPSPTAWVFPSPGAFLPWPVAGAEEERREGEILAGAQHLRAPSGFAVSRRQRRERPCREPLCCCCCFSGMPPILPRYIPFPYNILVYDGGASLTRLYLAYITTFPRMRERDGGPREPSSPAVSSRPSRNQPRAGEKKSRGRVQRPPARVSRERVEEW